MAKKIDKKSSIEKTDAEKWLDKIDRAKRVKEYWRNKFRVPLCYEYFEGNQRPHGVPEEQWITINMIYSVLVSELPTMYSTDPYFYINLKKSFSANPMDIAMFDLKAEVRQNFINYLKTTIDLKSKTRLCIFDAFFQYGIAKVHLYADIIDNPEKGKPILDDAGNPIFGDGDKPVMHPEMIPANKSYRLSRIHPDDFLVDEDAGPLDDDVNWKAHRVKRPISLVKQDKKYRKAARDIVQAGEYKTDDNDRLREERKKGLLQQDSNAATPDICILWELYDCKNHIWMTLGEGCKEFLIEPQPLPPGIDQDPFIDLRFLLRDDSWYPYPMIFPLLDPQTDYCDARSKVKTHRKRFNRKYTAYASAFDAMDTAIAQLQNGDDGAIILANQPGQIIYPIADAPLDQQIHTELAYLRHDFEDLAIGPNQRGSAQAVESATEAGILENRAAIREGDKVGSVKDFVVKIAEKLDHLVEAHITEDQAVKVSGPSGELTWKLIRADAWTEINGEYQYDTDVGATTPQLPEVERAQFNAVLQLLVNAPQLMQSTALLKRVFKMYNIHDQVLIEELYRIAQQMLSGTIPMPNAQGSVPGVPTQNPASSIGGTAAGINNFRGGAQ